MNDEQLSLRAIKIADYDYSLAEDIINLAKKYAAEKAEPFKWQPIETAPKDRWIFIEDKYFGVWQGRYNRYENIWIRVDDFPLLHQKAWFPLPDTPEQPSENKTGSEFPLK